LYNFRIKFKDNSSIPQILKDVKAMEPSNRLLNVPTSVVKFAMRKR
jgi:hypothetical protein